MRGIIAICLLLGGCATSGMASGAPYSLSAEQREAIRVALKPQMRDPESTIIVGNPIASRDAAGRVTVCGYVNGRNGYGGYATWRKQFSANLDQNGNVVLATVLEMELTPCQWGTPKGA
jgi:hypothetical protein